MEEFDVSGIQQVFEELSTKLRYKVVYVRKAKSTQDLARRLAEANAPEGTLVLAEEMSCGRGRMGRKWYAGPGGLWFTLVLYPRCSHIQLVGLAAALAVAKTVKELFGVPAGVKWPNDVIVGERKLCGILPECIFSGGGKFTLLLGVGINVNNELPSKLLNRAVSLKELIGESVQRLPLLREFLVSFDALYEKLMSGRAFEVVSELRRWTITLGKAVKVYTANGNIIRGFARDLASDGSLLVELREGRIVPVTFGEVVHLRASST